MGEKVQVAAKKPEVKRENLAYHIKNADQSQSMSSPVDQILYLQRTIGNQAVQRLIKSGALQAKLRIGQPGDKYEQEADRVADAVMRMPEPQVRRQPIEEEEEEQIQTKPVIEQITPLVQRQVEEEEEEQVQTKPFTEQITPLVQKQVEEEEEEQVQTKPVTDQITPLVQRQVEEEEEEQVQTKLVTGQFTPLVQRQVEEEEEKELRRQSIEEEEVLQAKTTSSHILEVQPNIESHVHSLKGGGQPLSENDRAYFEPRFDRDFSQVRVHTDTQAAETARGMNARAFTVGNNVVFGGDESQLASSSSQHLLAHELVHVVQQEGQATRIDRTPEDKARLNELPLSAKKTRFYFKLAFESVYAEAIEGIPNFEKRIKSACIDALEFPNLDIWQRGAIDEAAKDIASITDEPNIAGTDIEFNLAIAVKKLHELMPSERMDINYLNLGFEYMYNRLAEHSAMFVAVSLQEYAHGAEIAADPALSSVAARSITSLTRLDQDMTRIIKALSDGQSLLMLELEGTVQELVNLRNQYMPSSTQDQRRENQLERSYLARRAVLVNNKLLELMDSGNATTPTPLDESVKDILSKIRKTAQSEEKTLEALGDRKSLLAAQPLNLGIRVDDDDPYFKESGLSEESEALQIQPGHAFPKTTARIMTDTQRELADRINNQSDMLQEQMNKIVPPHNESKYNLKEFAQVYKHWFGLFTIEKEKKLIAQSHALDIWQGIHSATAIGTLSYSGDMMTAWLRYQTMQQALPLLGLSVSTGIDREFNRVIDRQRIGRSEALSGKGASDARYEFAELYDKQTHGLGGEEASRFNVGTQQSKKTAEKFSSVAKLPKFLQTQGASQLNVTPQPLPIQGLRTVEAKEGWSYLVEIPDYFSGETIAYEHKVATPEVAEYLLAYRQHVRTLRPHSAKVRVPSPKKQGYTMVQKPVGGIAFEGAPSAQKGILDRADLQPRKSIGMPSRVSQDQPAHGSVLVQKALMDYLDCFFKQRDPALRMAAIFHIMNVEHKIGKVFVKMLEPDEIAKVLGMAFGMGFGLSVLGRLGPIGQILSVGIGKGMKVSGGSDITAALTVTAFLKEASSVESFVKARIMGYIGLPIVMDIKQLFESAISAPAAMAGQKTADATITFVIDRINKKPPATIAEAAELGRQIAQASPEARQDMLAAIDSYLADLQVQGVGKNQSNQDYDVMIAFRNSLKSQSTIDQALDPFTTKLNYEAPEKSKFPFVDPDFRLRTAGERAKLLEAMGDMAGKVQLFEDPELTGGTVRVYYSDGKVRIHVGKDAEAIDIKSHMPVVRTLRKYEGVQGSIRILVKRAVSLLGLTTSPNYGKRGFEAELEIKKLTAIRDNLLAQQDATDLNARRLIDQKISRDVIDQHIIDVQKQILEHMRNLDSLEAGVGFVAARKKSAGTLKAETLGLEKFTPEGHYWRVREGRLELVQQDPKAEGYFINQDILKGELDKIDRGQPGDQKLAIRPVSEQGSAGLVSAQELGLEKFTPGGHVWRLDATGALGLTRRDNKAPHFWFDYESYSKAPDKTKLSQFIRPIAEKADSNSASVRFSAKSWGEAYIELGGDRTSSSFGKFTKVLEDLSVSKVEIIEKMKKTKSGANRDPSPEGLGIRTIRHGTKQYYIDNIIMPHLTNNLSLKDTTRYQEMVEAGKSEREALIAASHERMLTIARQLDSADKGSLGEKWYAEWFSKPYDRSQFSVSKEDIAKRYPGVNLVENRKIDLLRKVNADKVDIIEIKNVSGSLNQPRLNSEMKAHLLLRGKDIKDGNNAYIVRYVVWNLLNPVTLKEPGTQTFIINHLKEGAEFKVHTPDGIKSVTSENYRELARKYAGEK